MKGRFFYIIGISGALVVACQKEPQNKNSVFVIDNVAMYTELNIKDDILVQFNLGSGVIVDSVLIYDESGKLYTQSGVESSMLSTVSLNLSELKNGNYTVVTYQFFKSKDDQPIWFTTDKGDIASLSIQHINTAIDDIYALGVATDVIEVQNGFCEAQIEPKAAGSIIAFQLDDYCNSPSDGIPNDYHLPTIWLYGSSSCLGLYPGRDDTSRWMIQPDSSEIIGSMEEGQSQKKFFTLINGNAITISVRYNAESLFYIFFQGIINLSPGSNLVCFYDFTPTSFYQGFCGTYEEFSVFKTQQENEDCGLYPCLQWGASKDEVDHYVKSRLHKPTGGGDNKVIGNKSYIEYKTLPGLSEAYAFDSAGLSSVAYLYEGGNIWSEVISSMKKQGYSYLGPSLDPYYTTVYHYYLSPDMQTEFVIYSRLDFSWIPKGYSSWIALFFPSTQEDIDKFGIN